MSGDPSPTRYEQTFHRFYHRAVRIAFGIVGDHDLTEDIAQAAFVTAWSRRGGLRDPDALGSFVLRTARNLALNAKRDLARHRELLRSVPPPPRSAGRRRSSWTSRSGRHG